MTKRRKRPPAKRQADAQPAGIRYLDARLPHHTAPRAPAQLDQLIAREHKRITKLAQELERVRRRLTRARIRFSVLSRMAADMAKRGLQLGGVR